MRKSTAYLVFFLCLVFLLSLPFSASAGDLDIHPVTATFRIGVATPPNSRSLDFKGHNSSTNTLTYTGTLPAGIMLADLFGNGQILYLTGTALPGSAGSYSVTVSDTLGNSSTCAITVDPGPQTIVCDDALVPYGQITQLQPHPTNGNGDTISGTDAPTLTYESVDTGIAVVDGDGNVTALGAPGSSTTITIRSGATPSYEAAPDKTVHITVSKAHLGVSGNETPSGTVGAVGDKTVTATVAGSYPSSISLTASIGGHDVTVSHTGDGSVNFAFPSSVLNTLGAGSYPITVSAPDTAENEAIGSTGIGTLTIDKAQPALSGAGDRNGTVGSVGNQTFTATLSNAYLGAGPLSLEAQLGTLTVPVQAAANGGVSFTFAAADLNALPVGGYPVTVSFAGDANNHPASAAIGTLTLTAPNQYAVTLHQQPGGTATATPSGGTAGTEITLDAQMEPGATFVRWDVSPAVTWTVGDTTAKSAKFTLPSVNVSVTPVYNVPVLRSVTIIQQEGGTATATPDRASTGAEIKLKASPKSNYTFDRWAVSPAVTWVSGSATSATASFTLPDADATVTPFYTYHASEKKASTPRVRPDITVSFLQPYAFPVEGVLNQETIRLRPEPGIEQRPLLTQGELGQSFSIVDIIIPSEFRYGFYKVKWEGFPGTTYLALDYADVVFDPPLEGMVIKKYYAFSEKNERGASRAMEVQREQRVRLSARGDKWWTAEIDGQEVYLPTWNVTFEFEETELGIAEEFAERETQELPGDQ